MHPVLIQRTRPALPGRDRAILNEREGWITMIFSKNVLFQLQVNEN